MKADINKLFETKNGKAVYYAAKRAISDFSMEKALASGVLVGLSGGADSVMLLCLLIKLRDENLCGKIVAVHVNHMIRGAEADRDEAFSKELCDSLDVEFHSLRFDVPAEAKRISKGIEETARIVRYSAFDNIISGRSDVSAIAVAHNATDNVETVIFNMMRGAGLRGMSGISPTRDNIIRPLIYSPKAVITSALSDASVEYVTDSTNKEIDYKRNYIRSEILPKLAHLSECPENQLTRLSASLRSDNSYIEEVAKKFLNENILDGKVKKEELAKLHNAVLGRVVILMAHRGGATGIEYTHVSKIFELISNGDFSVSLPGAVSFISRDGLCYVGNATEDYHPSYEIPLKLGVNVIKETGYGIVVSDTPFDESFTNVYKTAIQVEIDSDIIKGGLFVRERREGDSYVYGGMTHKVKKLFCDRGIPKQERYVLPIVCDAQGIIWIPGFSQRGGGKKNAKNKFYVAAIPNILSYERHC